MSVCNFERDVKERIERGRLVSINHFAIHVAGKLSAPAQKMLAEIIKWMNKEGKENRKNVMEVLQSNGQ